MFLMLIFFFFQAEDGIRDLTVTGVQTCALPILERETARRPNLIVLKSMSKVYALSGLRVAYLVAPAVLRRRLARLIPPWPVGLAAQVAAVEALRDPQYYAARYAETHQLRRKACLRLSGISGLQVHPSQANFYLVETERAAALAERLRAMNI